MLGLAKSRHNFSRIPYADYTPVRMQPAKECERKPENSFFLKCQPGVNCTCMSHFVDQKVWNWSRLLRDVYSTSKLQVQ